MLIGSAVYKKADYESDVCVDWDENRHGDIDNQEGEYPEGFIDSGCGESGDFEACESGPHQRMSRKQRRH